MIKARSGDAILCLLDRKSIELMLDNKPIKIKGEEVGLPSHLNIFIIANETLEECIEDLRSIGITND